MLALTGCTVYHIRRLKAWVLVKCGTSKAALENLDEIENKARADLHQRGILLNDLSTQENLLYISFTITLNELKHPKMTINKSPGSF